MNYIYIGRYVNTHGIKGEIRIISETKHTDIIYKKGTSLFLGKDKKEYVISNYRKHKNFDMVTFEGINNINDILDLKGSAIYIDRDSIKEDILFEEDLIGMEVYTDHLIGKVDEILRGKNDILVIQGKKRYMVPFIDEFIKKIDIKNKTIEINVIEGLIDED